MSSILAPHIGEYIVDDGAGHSYSPETLQAVRVLFLRLKYSGLVPAVYCWDEASQRYEFSQALTEEMNSIPRNHGRPTEREGHYRRITLEIREDLLVKIDASGKSRREFIEELLDRL